MALCRSALSLASGSTNISVGFSDKPLIIQALRVQMNVFQCWGAKSYRANRNKSKEKKSTLRFLTNKSVAAFAALLIVPLPCQVEVVVVGQNGAQRFTKHLIVLWYSREIYHCIENM